MKPSVRFDRWARLSEDELRKALDRGDIAAARRAADDAELWRWEADRAAAREGERE